MYDRWVIQKDYTMPEIETPAEPELEIIVGTSGAVEPYSFTRAKN